MSTMKICKKVHKARDPGIQSGDLVLVELPNGDLKALKLENNAYVGCAHTSFFLNKSIQYGQPWKSR
jgi:tRNA (adenine-N(1)-)-methyltransferase non-catalytic subunit